MKQVETQWSRRDFLAATGKTLFAVGAVGALGTILEACSSSTTTASNKQPAGPSSLGTVAMQLLWIENVQFAGELIAQKLGFYQKQGVNVTLLPGGTTITPDPIVASGKALIGISSPSLTGAAVAQGADLTIVGAQYQRNPDVIISLAKTPITNLSQLHGKRIGVQPNIRSVWDAFLTVNNLQKKVTTVPVQDDPSLVVSGDVDGFVGFYTNEAVTLKVQGYHVVTMFLQDFGLPTLYETYCVRNSSLSDAKERQQIKAVLKADIEGWQIQLSKPTEGVSVVMAESGPKLGLNVKQQSAQAQAQNALYTSSATKTNGLFWMDPSAISESVSTLKKSGVNATSSLFTNELLKEIYSEDPKLVHYK